MQTPPPILLRHANINDVDRPAWFVEAYQHLRRIILDETELYPCYFATDGERTDANRYTYVNTDDLPHAHARLGATLAAFLEESARLVQQRLSLIVIVGPPQDELSLAAYEQQFWQLLRQLHQLDQQPWPTAVPQHPDDPGWEFCFAGEPLFVFGACPAYQARRSRNLGDCLVLVFQSKRVFRGISGETAAGRAAKTRIRSRLQQYDAVAPHAAMGPADHSSQRKWRQYFLPDDSSMPDGACPFAEPNRHTGADQRPA